MALPLDPLPTQNPTDRTHRQSLPGHLEPSLRGLHRPSAMRRCGSAPRSPTGGLSPLRSLPGHPVHDGRSGCSRSRLRRSRSRSPGVHDDRSRCSRSRSRCSRCSVARNRLPTGGERRALSRKIGSILQFHTSRGREVLSGPGREFPCASAPSQRIAALKPKVRLTGPAARKATCAESDRARMEGWRLSRGDQKWNSQRGDLREPKPDLADPARSGQPSWKEIRPGFSARNPGTGGR